MLLLPIDPVEVIWLNTFTGPRFRTALISAIERYGRDQVARALIGDIRVHDGNVTSIAAAHRWATDIVGQERRPQQGKGRY